MIHIIHQILKENNILSHKNQGITVAVVSNQHEGIKIAKTILYGIVDKKTVLYLSGGSLKGLYEQLAKEEKIIPGAVGLVDERFGPKFHENSNEKMIQDARFLRYLQMRDIPFYPILIGHPGVATTTIGSQRKDSIATLQNDRKRTAEAYDEKFRTLTSLFPKSVALLGIGPDGHTSSIIPNRSDFHNPWFDAERKHLMISEFHDPNSHYKERVGMTFLALSMLDMLIVPAFGSSKQHALKKLFEDGSEKEIPARFFKRPEIAEKTVLITDQTI